MTRKDQVSVTEYEVEEKGTPFSIVEHRLLHHRKVFLTGEITEESVDRVVKELFYLDVMNQDRITLYLNTVGGDVYEVLTLYDAIRKCVRSKVDIVAQGKALSSGACIIAICATGKRYAGANATFMLHEASASASGKTTDMELDVKETKRIDQRVNGLIVRHTRLKTRDLTEKFLKNTYFTSQKALEYGIIDKIL